MYKVFFEDTEKYSNFKLKCPFKKVVDYKKFNYSIAKVNSQLQGAYELYERPLKASQIPSFFTDIRFKVDLGFYTKKQLKYEMLFILKHDCIFKRVE